MFIMIISHPKHDETDMTGNKYTLDIQCFCRKTTGHFAAECRRVSEHRLVICCWYKDCSAVPQLCKKDAIHTAGRVYS